MYPGVPCKICTRAMSVKTTWAWRVLHAGLLTHFEGQRSSRNAVDGGRQLMRIAAIFERNFFVQRNGHAFGCVTRVGNLLAHPARNHAVVVRGDTKGLGCKSFAQSEGRAAAVGLHVGNQVRKLSRRRDDGDKGVVLGSRAYHGGATDVNVFNTNIEGLVTSRDGFEGVEVRHLHTVTGTIQR